MKKIVIVGAGSAIAQAVAKLYAAENAAFFLVDRNGELLQAVAQDLAVRGAKHVEAVTADVTAFDRHAALFDQAAAALGGLDIVLLAHGTLPKQPEIQDSWADTLHALEVNQLSMISLMIAAASRLTSGSVLAVMSSVAGDRGRQSNYVYSTAKGAIALFASGLRNRLANTGSGIQVLTIKPGFVDTPMTAEFKKGLLWVSPARVARDIVRAIEQRKNMIYTPWFWRYIMLGIRNIPEPLFKKMKL